MIKESAERAAARKDPESAISELANLNMDDPSNFLDDQEKEDLPKGLEKAVIAAQQRLEALIKDEA